MDGEPIVIKKKDLQPKNLRKLKGSATGEKQVLDLEMGLYVVPGVPVKDVSAPESRIEIPDEPHVLVVGELHVTNKYHRDLVLNNVSVMLAHGHRVGEEWQFANGQSVVETVKAWDVYAKINDLPDIEFVVACNEEIWGLEELKVLKQIEIG